jgi:penicillin-binding protein 1A
MTNDITPDTAEVTLKREPVLEPDAEPARRGWFRRTVGRLYKMGLVLGLIGIVCAMLGYAYFSRDLMTEAQLREYEPPLATSVLSGDGTPMTVYARERRSFVPYDQIPKLMEGAILSAEDKTFYNHSGLDYPGIAQAMLTNWKLRGKNRRPVGASTITQQVAKNLLGDNEAAIARKIREMILALRMERVYTKERILELYLNQIFLGKNSYGIAAAAKTYFNKSLNELAVEEFAYLAALPKAPNNYDPIRFRDRALQRRNMILDQMAKNLYITPVQADAAKARPIAVNYQRVQEKDYSGDYFFEEVRREAIRIMGDNGKDPVKGEKLVYEGGLTIRATIDPKLQEIAERVMRNSFMRLDRRGWHGIHGNISLDGNFRQKLAKARVPIGFPEWKGAVVMARTSDGGAKIALEEDGVEGFIPKWQLNDMRGSGGNAAAVLKAGDLITVSAAKGAKGQYALKKVPEISGALVVQEPNTGRVLAMVGGFDSRKSQFNRATQAMRQPGSSFKPIVYAAALENGMTPSSIVVDAEFCVWQNKKEGRKCFRNFSAGRTYGPQTLRVGLELSRNLMTVRLADKIGMKKVSKFAEALHVYDRLPPYYAMALGAGETTPAKMVNAYSMFANNGKRVNPDVIESIQDRRGKVIWRRDPRSCAQCNAPQWTGLPPPEIPDTREQVVNAWTAYQITHMMEGVIQRGTGKVVAQLDRPLAGKTGTTTDAKDVWFIGMSPDLVAGLYIGYDKPRPMGSAFQGGTVAAPIFRQFMQEALKDTPKVPFRLPDGIRLVRVDAKSGKLGGGGETTIYEAFKPGTEPLRASQKQSVPVTFARSDAEFQSDTGGIY